jgi:hypothetical protein
LIIHFNYYIHMFVDKRREGNLRYGSMLAYMICQDKRLSKSTSIYKRDLATI